MTIPMWRRICFFANGDGTFFPFTMITDYLLLSPGGEILCTLQEIRRYVELHYDDRDPCLRCGCYLIPTGENHRLMFRQYRCANSICSGSRKTFRFWSSQPWRAA